MLNVKPFLNNVLVLTALALGSAGAAQAANVQFKVTDQFGTSITLDTASCTSGSISAPFSIANGGSATFSGSTTDSTTLCTVKYQSGLYGCKFDVQVSSFGGFASASAYKGSGGRPGCVKVNEGSLGTGSYFGEFRMQ
jgi:type 1 fimbria pilin